MASGIPPTPILVTGATGYVGGRLVPLLLSRGFRVRAVSRSMTKLAARPWSRDPGVELVACDLGDRKALTAAAKGCHTAFYLVHSMEGTGSDFHEKESVTAIHMVLAAAAADLTRIIYLSGLGMPEDPHLSVHLQSRHRVARILQAGPVPVTVLRAAMIIGSGSASFEILRYLVDRLPVMATPRWIRTPCQPIAIRNVLEYLVSCLHCPETTGKTLDIGGPDILTYEDLMRCYAAVSGVGKRLILPVPFQTPKLSALWVRLVTPLPKAVAMPLAEGLRNPVVCEENRIREWIPQRLLSCEEAIREAVRKVDQEQVETRWSDAGRLLPPEWVNCTDPGYAGGTILDCCHRIRIACAKEAVWERIAGIGGEAGWYFGNILWRIRGVWDQLAGGVGLRRGRRNPRSVRVGDALDFWRVLDVKEKERLLLVAEMRLPGEALLEFRLEETEPGIVTLSQMSRFLPRGITGILYWYLLLPFHHWIFKGMLVNMAEACGQPLGRPIPFSYDWQDATCSLPDIPEKAKEVPPLPETPS